jgi:hypothetical protein
MRHVLSAARSGLVLMALAGSAFAAESRQMAWWITEFTYVKRVAKEANAPANDQPIKLAPEMVSQDLAAIRLNPNETLFDSTEIKELMWPICQALSLAKPNEDVILLSTSARGGGLLGTRSALTARLFVREGRLNLILHDTRNAFYDRYLGTKKLPEFKFGSRTEPSPVDVDCPGAEKVRGDWLTFPAILHTPKPAVGAMVPAAAVPSAVPAPAAVPVPVPEPATQARDEAYYEQQQVRLRAITRLHDEKLISDAEFNEKRKEILGGL